MTPLQRNGLALVAGVALVSGIGGLGLTVHEILISANPWAGFAQLLLCVGGAVLLCVVAESMGTK